MQQRVEEPKGLTEEEQEIYESISSQRSTQFNKDTSQHQNTSSLKEKCISRPIVFPQQPKQLPTLFQIYQKNAQKIHQLRAQVSQLESNILEQLRFKNLQEDVELSIQGIEEIDIGVYKIGEFEEKRKERESKLKRLSALYDSLRKINRIEGFLLKEENHQSLIEMIRNKWLVQEYRVVSHSLIILTKCHNSKTEVELDISQERKLQTSNIFIPEQDINEPHLEQGYIVAIFSLPHLLNWLSPKQVNFQLGEDNNQQKLQRCKEEAEMSRLISKKIYISTAQPLVTATYSHKLGLVFAIEESGRLLVLNGQGKEMSFTLLDKIDQVISIEVIKDDLLVGTSDGVARVYKIKHNGLLKLNRVVMCFWKTLSTVLGFRAIGQQEIERIRFCVRQNLYQYNLKTNLIAQVSHLGEESLLQGFSQYPKHNAALQQFISMNEPERQALCQCIKKYWQKYKQWKGSSEMIHVSIQQAGEGQKRYHLLKGDKEGQLELLTI